jgi:protein arginine kinase activator
MKMCDECGLFPGNIHLTQIVEKGSESFHLCAGCAKRHGIHVTADENEMSVFSQESAENRECPSCRMKLSEFRSKGRLGCPACYEAFDKEIEMLLNQVHGSSDYRGKKYRSTLINEVNKGGLSQLCLDLDAAIKNEEFERAAVLRDAIHDLNTTEGK